MLRIHSIVMLCAGAGFATACLDAPARLATGTGITSCGDTTEPADAGTCGCDSNPRGGCFGPSGEARSVCPDATVCSAGPLDSAGETRGFCVPSHYVDNHDGTVTDTASCLTWQQKLEPLPCPSSLPWYAGSCNWKDAQTYCANLNLGGTTGWRVPTLPELYSLVEANGGLDNTAFPDAPDIEYWTSTGDAQMLYPNSGPYFWTVNFLGGETVPFDASNAWPTRCVR